MDTIYVWKDGGELRGVAIDIPCPSPVEEHLTVFSADFWHDIRVDFRHRFGSNLHLFPPHFLLYEKQESEMRARLGLTERQEIALRVGAAVERSLACTHPAPTQLRWGTCRPNASGKGGHYGVHPVVAPVGPEGGRCLVEEFLDLIDEVMEVRSSRTSIPRSTGASSKRR